MKHIIFTTLIIVSFSLQAAEKEITTNSKIKNVTVFLAGAEITHEATVSLEPGRTTLKFSGLSSKLIPSSISASSSIPVKIISISNQFNYLTPVIPTGKVKILHDSLEDLSFQYEKVKMELSSYSEELKLLSENRTRIGEESGIKISELTNATSFYRNKLNEINNRILYLNRLEKKLSEKINRLTLQLNSLNSIKEKLVYEIFITTEAQSYTKATIRFSYLVKEAAWAPKYDLRTQGAGFPIELNYRAEVFNNSGEDWENIQLTLSTAEHKGTIERPTLQPWGLSYSRNRRGQVIPRTTGGSEGLLSNYQPKSDNKKSDQDLRQVEVSYSDIEVSELSVEFAIKNNTSIPSDGKLYLVDVNDYKLEASYDYFSIPKVDRDAFLLAKLVGWESLNLIPGLTNIYLNGTYIGQSHLDTRYSNDTLELSLGRDRKVIVSRVKKEDFNSKKLIGLNRCESFTYEIDIRNTNTIPIEIELQDQVPITQESDIEINVSDISGATHDIVSGKLIWKLKIEPSESKKLMIAYSIKYPRNKDIIIRKSRVVACPKFRN